MKRIDVLVDKSVAEKSRKPVDVSIVVPCYCSGKWLSELVTRIEHAFELRDESIEIIFVNDASPDNNQTWENIKNLSEENPAVLGFDLMFNTGQYRTTMCGIVHATGNWIVTIDDDLQHSPEDIPILLDALSENDHDCVIASFRKKQHDLIRLLGTKVREKIFSVFYGKPKNVKATGFRVMTRDLAHLLTRHATVNPNLNALIFKSTSRIGNVEVGHNERPYGKSGYTLSRLTIMLFDSIFTVSTLPLKIVSLVGLASAGISGLFGAYYFFSFVIGGGVARPGFTTIVLFVILFGGMTLFSVGLLGEYFIRVLEEVKGKPWFYVREETDRTE